MHVDMSVDIFAADVIAGMCVDRCVRQYVFRRVRWHVEKRHLRSVQAYVWTYIRVWTCVDMHMGVCMGVCMDRCVHGHAPRRYKTSMAECVPMCTQPCVPTCV